MLRWVELLLTVEEVALVLQDLADLVHPELADGRAGGVQAVALLPAAGGAGGERELAGVVRVLLQTQPAHLEGGRSGREGVEDSYL